MTRKSISVVSLFIVLFWNVKAQSVDEFIYQLDDISYKGATLTAKKGSVQIDHIIECDSLMDAGEQVHTSIIPFKAIGGTELLLFASIRKVDYDYFTELRTLRLGAEGELLEDKLLLFEKGYVLPHFINDSKKELEVVLAKGQIRWTYKWFRLIINKKKNRVVRQRLDFDKNILEVKQLPESKKEIVIGISDGSDSGPEIGIYYKSLDHVKSLKLSDQYFALSEYIYYNNQVWVMQLVWTGMSTSDVRYSIFDVGGNEPILVDQFTVNNIGHATMIGINKDNGKLIHYAEGWFAQYGSGGPDLSAPGASKYLEIKKDCKNLIPIEKLNLKDSERYKKSYSVETQN